MTFGMTLARFVQNLSLLSNSGQVITAAPDSDQGKRIVRRAGYEVAIQVVVTLAALGAGFYIILHGGFGEGTEKAACGWVGAVVGYWLR